MIDQSVTFIVPCFNEELRLEHTEEVFVNYFIHDRVDSKVIFVDDGSGDATSSKLHTLCQKLNQIKPKCASYISYEKNVGKGYALKKGIEACTTNWCLTIDADMAAQPQELITWTNNYDLNLSVGKVVYIGSREKGIDKHLVKSSLLRRNMGLVFNKLLTSITGLKFRDTQCGFKLYPTDVAKMAFDNLSDYGFAHDVEVLLKLQREGFTIKTFPIKWVEKAGSKVNLISDSLKMIRTVIKIRNKYK